MYKRNLQKKHECKFNIHHNKASVFRESSQVDTFYREESISSLSGEKLVFYRDPIYMLFNQQRLSLLGPQGVENYLKTLMAQTNNPLSELRKQCSDEDLIATIKSRHLQAPSEILAWSRYMANNAKEFESAVQSAKEQIQQQQQTNAEQSAV